MESMANIALLFLMLSLQTSILAGPSARNQVQSPEDAFSWLNKYGYNPCFGGDGLCNLPFSSLLKDYQRSFRLRITGTLDEATKKHMNRPRCGNQDKAGALLSSSGASNEFKWTRSSLKYAIEGHPIQLSRSTTKTIIREALQTWLEHIPLTIEETCSGCSADIVFNFTSGSHADDYPFDGIAGTLAHAFRPEDGRVHFDKDEPWTERFNDDNEKKNLFLVAVHEIGHALGLEHNYDDQSIMFPTYQAMPRSRILPQVDRDAIRSIYGSKQSVTSPDPTPMENSNAHCSRFLDAAFKHPDGTLHTFVENTVRRYFPGKHRWEEQSIPSKQLYRSLPSKLGAVVYNPQTQQAIFFTEQYLYVYDIDSSNQAPIRYLRPLPKSLRSPIYGALYYKNDIYLITEKTIALFQLDRPRITKERPLQAEFPKFTGSIETAFSYGHLHHFFTTDGLVYVWNELSNAWKTFAQPMQTNWFACSSAPSLLTQKRRRLSHHRRQ